MTDRAASRLAWALLAFALACVVAASVIVLATDVKLENGAFPLLATVTFSVVGTLVAAGQPRNAIGWLLLAIGLAGALGLPTGALYQWGQEHRGVPGTPFYAWLDGMLWLLWIGFLVPRVMLLFPDGRPPTRRWRVVSVAQYTALAGLLVGGLEPGPIHDYEEYDNPLGIGLVGRLEGLSARVDVIAGLLFVVSALGAVVALIVRFHRSRGVERLQLKWVTWAVGVTAALWIGGSLVESGPVQSVVEWLGLLSLCLAPVTIGIAVLRYRLYEIDRVISRTLVYGGLTVLLGGAYVGLVLAGQALFSSFAGGSNLAIAVSTLLVAALFLPARSRVQHFVDRRFYRRRYDAQRTLEGFGARLREQVELSTLERDLQTVVTETMQPAHTSLWLRTEAGR